MLSALPPSLSTTRSLSVPIYQSSGFILHCQQPDPSVSQFTRSLGLSCTVNNQIPQCPNLPELWVYPALSTTRSISVPVHQSCGFILHCQQPDPSVSQFTRSLGLSCTVNSQILQCPHLLELWAFPTLILLEMWVYPTLPCQQRHPSVSHIAVGPTYTVNKQIHTCLLHLLSCGPILDCQQTDPCVVPF